MQQHRAHEPDAHAGSHDPWRHSRSISVLESLDWLLSVALGFGAAAYLHQRGLGLGAICTAGVTAVVALLDLAIKARLAARSARADDGKVVTGIIITVLWFVGTTVLYVHGHPAWATAALALLLLLVILEAAHPPSGARDDDGGP